MADEETLTPSTPATLPSGGGIDLHAMLHRIEGLLSWTKDHIIQQRVPGGDVSDPATLAAEKARVVKDYAKTGAAPNQTPAPEGGMSADVLARAASRTPAQYQQGNPSGPVDAPAQLSLEEFAQQIKAKYPDYKDVPDRELGQKMLDKYPEYRARVKVTPDFKADAEKPSLFDLAVESAKGWMQGVNPLPALESMYGKASAHYDAAEAAAKTGQYGEALKQNVQAAVAPGLALAEGVGKAHWEQIQKAREAYKAGRTSEAIGHTIAAVLPFLGPLSAASGEAIGTGDPRTMARGVGLGLAALTPSAVKYGTERFGASSVRVPPIARNPNPAEAAAVDFGLERGIPVDAGTASGNPVIRGTRAVADNTSLAGAYVGNRARATQAEAFSRVGNDLATDVHPEPTVPTQAGEGVRTAIGDLVGQLHEQANTAYDKLRTLEADPSSAREVPTVLKPTAATTAAEVTRLDRMQQSLGHVPTPREINELRRIHAELDNLPYVKRTWNEAPKKSGNAAGGDYDITPGAAGAPVYDDILQASPGTSTMTRAEVKASITRALDTGTFTNAAKGALDVARARIAGSGRVSRASLPPEAGAVPMATEDMHLPVDLTASKKMLQPVYEQMKRQMPITQRESSPGLLAIENIINGPDFAPLSQVDRDLSAIKAVARREGGLAKFAVNKLSAAVDAAAQKGGPEAVAALEEGRAATTAKYAAQAVLDKLRMEPRQAFDQLTRAKDAAVDQLKAVRELAPAEIPKIGRAVIEDLLQTATAEGGFSRAQGLWAKWQNLGPETKSMLFGSSLPDLDRFFLLAKKAEANPNPSGSAYVGGLMAHSYFLRDPVTFVGWEISGGALASLLRSPAAVKALTQGMTITLRNKPAASAAAATILRVAGEEGFPFTAVPAAAGPGRPGSDQLPRSQNREGSNPR